MLWSFGLVIQWNNFKWLGLLCLDSQVKEGYKSQSLFLLLVLFTSIGFDVAYMYSQAIVDPYVYIPRLTMPKLIITSSNDEFFPIDDRYLQNPLFSSSGSFFIFPYSLNTISAVCWKVSWYFFQSCIYHALSYPHRATPYLMRVR
jgi:hypothetical protein